MTSSPRPGSSPPQGAVVVGALALVGILGLVVIAIALGALGPAPTHLPDATASPAATPAATAVPSPASPSAAAAIPSPDATPSPSGVRSTATPGPSGVGPAATPSADPLLLGLLTEADLPGLTSPLGPQEGTDYDIDEAAFEANGGIRVVSRTWQSLSDTGLAAAFDFRMQFPTDEAAAAYLAAAEPVLSEADATGQAPVPSPPVIGSDGRVYGLETAGDTGPVLLRTYLFRVGSVAAKVVVGGPGVEPATADAVAASAAARILAAGPPPPGTPRPAVSPTPVPLPSAPLPTGEALAALLLDHVPPRIGPTCVPDTQRLWQGELATLACTDDASGVSVTYSGFESVDSLEAAFDASLGTIDLPDPAASCDLGPYVGTYQVEDEDVGRVACWAEEGGQAIMWSDDRLAILAVAASPTLDPAGLYLWWLDAGPVP